MRLDKSKKHYISGPRYEKDSHAAFNGIAKLLRDKGFRFVSACDTETGMADLRDCDAIIMLQDWNKSARASDELKYALDVGMPVICESDLYTHNVIGRIAVESE